MAQKIDVEVRAEADQFHEEIRKVNKELKTLRKQWSDEDRATRGYATKSEKLAKSVESLSKQYNKQGGLLDSLREKEKILMEQHQEAIDKRDKLGETYDKQSSVYTSAADDAENYSKKLESLREEIKGIEYDHDLLGKKLYGAELNYNTYENTLSKVGRTFSEVGAKITNFGSGISEFGMNMMPLSLGITAFGKSSYEAFKQYELGVVGVQKTNDELVGKSLEKFKDQINEIATLKPLPIADLLKVSELGGQLDIAKEHLASFSEVINELAITTDLNVEDASLKFAQFMNVMGTDDGDVRKIGNVITELGNNTATTEQNIIDFSHRLMAAGRQVGLTEADVLSLSATLGSTGAQVEAGGSNLSKTLLEIEFATSGADEKAQAYTQKLKELGLTTDDVKKASKEGGDALEQMAQQFGMQGFELEAYNELVLDGAKSIEWFAKAANMSAEEFTQTWKNDPMEAIQKFIEGLHKMEEEGGSAAAFLEQMGIKNLRQRDVLLKLASGYDVLTKASSDANKEWANGNALAEEANKFYESHEGKMQRLRNQIDMTKIAIGEKLAPIVLELFENVNKLLDGFNGLSDGTQDFIIKAGIFLAVLGPMSLGIGSIIKAVGGLTSGIGQLLGEKGLGGIVGKAMTSKDALGKLISETGKIKGASESGVGTLIKLLGKGIGKAGTLTAELGLVGLGLKGLKELASYEIDEYNEKKNWNKDPKLLTADVVKENGKYKRKSKGDVTTGGVNAGVSWSTKVYEEDVFEFSDTTKELMTLAETRNQKINNILSQGFSFRKGLQKEAHEDLKDLITEQDVALRDRRVENQKKTMEIVNDLDVKSSKEKVEQAKALGEKINAYYERQTQEQKDLHHRRGEILEELTNAQGQKRIELLKEWYEKEKEWKQLELEEYAQNEDEKIILEQRLADFRIEQGKEVAVRLIEQAQETRDESIRIAEEQYDGVILEAKKMLKAGDINQEEYNRMIQLAREARDNAIEEANKQMTGILTTMSEKMPGVTLIWDEATKSIKIKYTETGEVVDFTSENIAAAMQYAGGKAKEFSNTFSGAMGQAIQDAKNLIEKMREINGTKLSDKTVRIHYLHSGTGAMPSSYFKQAQSTGSYMAGIKYVPYNDMVARLHEGERVLTKEENRVYNEVSSVKMLDIVKRLSKKFESNLSGAKGDTTNTYDINVNLNDVVIKDDRDVRQLTKDIANELRKEVALG